MDFTRNRMILLVLLFTSSLSFFWYSFLFTATSEPVPDIQPPEVEEIAGPPEPKIERIEDVIPRRSSLQEVLFQFGFSPADLHALIRDVRDVYNLNRIRAGNSFAVERLEDGTFKRFEYQINDEEYLVVEPDLDRYVGAKHQHEFDVVVESLYGEIESSLWQALISRGETDKLVHLVHEVLQWDIDFTRIQRKDSFKLIFEKKYLNGELVKYGEMIAVEFNSGGRSFYAFVFEDPEDGRKKYYDDKGNAVRKALLKVPFKFDPRITSGFSHSRYHPILKRRRPHLGVDYGAPHGTPVLAAGSGVVIFAGTDGGYGKVVRIRHPNGYVTGYAHLSRIGVRRGQTVQQGQTIGRVGSTGLATGPHLDYRVQEPGGRYINPTKVSALPSDKPVDKRYWDQFVAVRDDLIGQLASVVPPAESVDEQLAQTD